MVTPDVAFSGELIGKRIRITAATNPTLVGSQGVVVDETKSTIALDCQGKTKVVLKRGITFQLEETGKSIKGISLLRRPEERSKNP